MLPINELNHEGIRPLEVGSISEEFRNYTGIHEHDFRK
jgi:hypothetical protein